MSFDGKRFLRDNNIYFDTEGKNWSQGFVQVRCCFCDDHSNHLGIPVESGMPNCWRCGPHSVRKVIKELLQVSWGTAAEIEKEYSLSLSEQTTRDKYAQKKRENEKELSLKLPSGTQDLLPMHKKYLRKRGFKPKELVEIWGIKGTGPVGKYKFRIMIPIYVDEKLVSYQARDITGKTDLRYKACSIDNEIVHHKFVCYGIDKVKNGVAIINEGILDVWKLGPGAICTFGTGWTKEQILFLSERIEYAFVLYDSEPEAQEKAEKLCQALSDVGIGCENVLLTDYGDPGEMPKEEAEEIRKNLIGY
jgi:DNA primase